MKPSCSAVLDALRAAGPDGLTSLEAWRAGCGSRLAARVADLEAAGYAIRSQLVPVQTATGTVRVARYHLASEPPDPLGGGLPRGSSPARATASPEAAPEPVRYGRPVGRQRLCPGCHSWHQAGTTCAQPTA